MIGGCVDHFRPFVRPTNFPTPNPKPPNQHLSTAMAADGDGGEEEEEEDYGDEDDYGGSDDDDTSWKVNFKFLDG